MLKTCRPTTFQSHQLTVREDPLGQHVSLTTSDHHKLGGYRADPQGKPKGGIVVVQEIFGVNHHIRGVCDRLADEGYVAIAPAIFDRIEQLVAADVRAKAVCPSSRSIRALVRH